MCVAATPSFAADGIDGAHMSLLWAAPFAGVLLSIAVGPMLAARWWHPHYGKAATVWVALAVIPMVATFGLHDAAAAFFHTMAQEYAPFIIMLFALFTTAGGLLMRGGATGSPISNVAILAIGSALANVIGTMGAAMILIRPLLRANAAREKNVHVTVFFIFLVANIGGALTPLGDPPLFLGFLRGVDFFWTTRFLLAPTACLVGVLLVVFYLIDLWLWSRESTFEGIGRETFAIEGKFNLLLILIAVGAIAASGIWTMDAGVTILGARLEAQNLLRDGVLVLVGLVSLAATRKRVREQTGFEWSPLVEVAILFAAIFVCIVPVIAMLNAKEEGPFAALIALTSRADGSANNVVYFWLSGMLSAFLDSAPAYLVFFEVAGGDPVRMMGASAPTLVAISLGTVFMGALTYIGNAPNFIVYAIARDSGVRMPGFFGYMLWSFAILLPLFIAVTFIFIR
jgi:Na+/H+ antiporter NhaD/arsenite permease-like protein